jgi:hypothetical protein
VPYWPVPSSELSPKSAPAAEFYSRRIGQPLQNSDTNKTYSTSDVVVARSWETSPPVGPNLYAPSAGVAELNTIGVGAPRGGSWSIAKVQQALHVSTAKDASCVVLARSRGYSCAGLQGPSHSGWFRGSGVEPQGDGQSFERFGDQGADGRGLVAGAGAAPIESPLNTASALFEFISTVELNNILRKCMRQNLLVLVTSIILLTGCAATSSVNYSPPTETKTQNSKTVQKSFDEVWDRLVKQLSSDFFVINNIDKSSRLINLSFTSNTPSKFVDCGYTSRGFKNPQGERAYNYQTADSAAFSYVAPNGFPLNAQRNTKLEGRTNIYIAPEGKDTLISVNTKYVVSVNLTASTFDGRPAGSQNISLDFSTKQGYMGDGNKDSVTCYSIGTVEQRILQMID